MSLMFLTSKMINSEVVKIKKSFFPQRMLEPLEINSTWLLSGHSARKVDYFYIRRHHVSVIVFEKL